MDGPPDTYRLLLRLLPRGFRERNERDMTALFREHLEERSGAWGRFAVRAGAAWDVLRLAAALRLRRLGRSTADTGRNGEGTMGTMLDGWLQDLKFAARSLRSRPGFTLVAVGVLAVGIGANTTIFSVVDGVLLRPLPYEHSERIGVLWHEFGEGAQNLPVVNPLDLYDYREWSEVFEAFTMGAGDERILGGQDDPRIVQTGFVEAGFFEFFGVEPLLGRTILAEDDVPAAAPVVMLSHRLWATRYGGDAGVVGRSVVLDGETHRVVGVLPPGFRLHLPPEAIFLRDSDVWTAARLDPAEQPPRNYTLFTAFGRIRPGATFEEAQAELDRMEARLKELHPVHASANLQARVAPLLDDVVREARSGLVFLFAAVGLVLVVACANVANLLLVRMRGRETEISIRSALGAGRRRVVRLVLVESLALGATGGALGVALALAGVELVRSLGRPSLPRMDTLTLDGRVLAFALGASLLAALAAGLLPALRAASDEPGAALTSGARAGGSRTGARFRDGLVTAEVALSLVLLVGTGLMIRSFHALQRVDPGFEPAGVYSFRVSLPDEGYPDDASEQAFYERLEEDLTSIPGVVSVSAVSQLPLTGSGYLQPYAYDEETATHWESVTADRRRITPGFFETMGATMLAGREFGPGDLTDGRQVLIVDDRLAERAFPDGDAVGRRLQIYPNEVPEDQRYAVVIGVVDHLRLHDLARPHLTQVWVPLDGSDQYSVVLRTEGPTADLPEVVRRRVEAMGPGIAFEDFRSMETLVAEALAPTRALLVLMLAFGGIALAMASVGLYGVIAYTVRQRTREIGVRMALGQSPGEVRRLVLGRGMRLVARAVVLGVLGAATAAHFASSVLYGVAPFDPVTYLGVTGVLAASAVLACWIPASRATRIEPSRALRTE